MSSVGNHKCGYRVTGVTTAVAVDSIPADSISTIIWLVQVVEEADPNNREAIEVTATTNGTTLDKTMTSKLKVGNPFNFDLTVDLVGGELQLIAQSTSAGVTVDSKRVEIISNP